MNLFNLFLLSGGGGGLNGLVKVLTENWIGPVFLIMVAGFALAFLKNREFRALIVFAIIAIIVALFIFMPDKIFGKKGKLTNQADKVVDTINYVDLVPSEVLETGK